MSSGDAVTADNLYFGTDHSDPTGVADCEVCGGGPHVAFCESCDARQTLRDAWWNSSTGPARLGLPAPSDPPQAIGNYSPWIKNLRKVVARRGFSQDAESMDTTTLTARIPEGFHPEDAFTAVDLTRQPSTWPAADTCYQWLALDLNDGRLWFGDTGFIRKERLEAALPGYLRHAINDETVPPTGVAVALIPNGGYDPAHYPNPVYRLFDAQTLYDLANRVLPMAARVVETMHRVGPRAELEWSAAADHAWRNLVDAAQYESDNGVVTWKPAVLQDTPDYCHEAVEFIERYPHLVDPAWVTATDAELDAYAAYSPSSGYGGVPGRMCSLGNAEIYDGGWGGHSFYGHRAALYDYRARAAGDRTVVDAAEWLENDEHGKEVREAVTVHGAADITDEGLVNFASRIQASAAARGLILTGLPEYLKALRADARGAVERMLARTGADVNNLEHQLTIARRERAAILSRVLWWNDGRSDHFLGKLAGMSHTAVGNLRERLTPPVDEDHDDQTEAAS